MPLPIGHAVIGFTTQSLFSAEESSSDRWKALLGILILSNLPDVDVLLGIVFHGNGNVFHRGPTHSCVFRRIPATDSDPSRPPIPEQVGHPFRFIPAGHSDPIRPPLRGDLSDAG
jgi:hypothetical protein